VAHKPANKTKVVADKHDNNEHHAKHKQEMQSRLNRAMWRDAFFLLLGCIALNIISYVETHAADATIRGAAFVGETTMERNLETTVPNSMQIVDAGFVLTAPLREYLAEHRSMNDLLAFLNSLLLVFPSIYVAKVTVWNGDYTVSFRVLMTQLFRSFCGWFTYLPPDPTFLMSYYDFPEVVQCVFLIDCSSKDPSQEQVLPFVSFFSGHVATVVIVANHMYVNGHVKSCLALHVLNVLQTIRLLATRGHYSIDIIIGWCVAVYVSNPAERLGRYYSRGMPVRDMLPADAKSAFEAMTGVRDVKNAKRYSVLIAADRHNIKAGGISPLFDTCTTNGDDTERTMTAIREFENMDGSDDSGISASYYSYEVIQSETTANVVAEIASEFAAKHQDALREELRLMGLKMKELRSLRREDLMRLRALAELKMGELRAEATRTTGFTWGEGTSREDILAAFIRPIKEALETKLHGQDQ
jgi:hypothetical protein